MKRNLLVLLGMVFTAGLNAQITYTTATTPVTCFGGSDGSATITSISGGFSFNNSTKGLLISEIFTDNTGSDSPFEFVELVATRAINFASTPYTVIFCNNGTANASGWIAGTSRTYAFSITSGNVTPGQVVYVGGSSMTPLTNQLRVINTGTTGGDGGIGNAVAAGVLGNGGVSCDGVAVFNGAVATITANTVPIDAIFFGDDIGAAYLSSASGYQLPVNDAYAGGKLDTISYFIPLPASIQNMYIKADFGVYNTNTNLFTYPRTWSVTNTFTDVVTSILLDGIYNVNWSNACTSVYNPNLSAGPYTFTISDALSNFANGNVMIADGPLVDLNATANDLFACDGDVINLSAANADTYLWNTGDTISNPSITVTSDTLLIVMGTDTVTGCTSPDSVFIDVNAYPVVSFSMTNDSVCNDGGIVLLSASPIGGVFTGTGVAGDSLDPSALSGVNMVTYTYTDGNGCSDFSSENYLVLNCTGIENIDENMATVYPNPATEFLLVSTFYEGLNFWVTDLQGKQVISGSLTAEKMIPIQQLTHGVYILTLSNKDSIKRMKFIKN